MKQTTERFKRVGSWDGKGSERAKKARHFYSISVTFTGIWTQYHEVEEILLKIIDIKDICIECDSYYYNTKMSRNTAELKRYNHKPIVIKPKKEVYQMLSGWKKRLKRALPWLRTVTITANYNQRKIEINLR